MALQAPHQLLMVRPAAFGANPQTSGSNTFQHALDLPVEHVRKLALEEFDRMVDVLIAHDIQTLVVPDTEMPEKPDAIFPNNWVSMQPDGKLVTYPMLAPNRRLERSEDILASIENRFLVSERIDFSEFEAEGEIVEGTGSLVFDHINRIAYAARSPRTNENLVEKICARLSYDPIVFDAADESERPIYHTNVMMAVATEFAIICLDAIKNDNDQDNVLDALTKTGHKVIAISYDQMKAFAGNVLEVLNKNNERVLIISETSIRTLLPGQLDAITKFVDVLPISIPTIEKYSGGSVRCLLAGIYLQPKI